MRLFLLGRMVEGIFFKRLNRHKVMSWFPRHLCTPVSFQLSTTSQHHKFHHLSLDSEHLYALNTPEHFLMFVHQSHSSLNIPDILAGGNLPMLIFFTKLLVPIPILFSVELKNEELILFLEENTCTGLARFCGRDIGDENRYIVFHMA